MDIDASHLNLCGQTVRNNLKQQDPDNVWVQRVGHKNWRCWGVQKTCHRWDGLARHSVLWS